MKDLEDIVKNTKESRDELQFEFNSLQSKYNQEKGLVQTLELEKKKLQAELESVKIRLDGVSNHEAALDSEMHSYRSRIGELSVECSSLRSTCEAQLRLDLESGFFSLPSSLLPLDLLFLHLRS